MARRRTLADEQDQPQVEAAGPAVRTSITLAEAFEALKDAENMSPGAVRQAKIAAARKLCGDLQQGLPVIDVTADGLAKSAGSTDEIWMLRLKELAKSNKDVERLLKERT
jgi:hypothetical protein